MYFLYSFLYVIVLIFLLPVEFFKRPRDIRVKWLREKFGMSSAACVRNHAPCIWMHAVSVGEVHAALPLVERLRSAYPRHRIILSTITDTGRKVAREKSPEGTVVVYLPFDVSWIIGSILRKVQPEVFILIETEIWPNLLRVCSVSGIPVLLLNGRMSEKSFRGYQRVSFFMKRVLSSIDCFGMQSEADAERIGAFGVDDARIQVIGSFKFDANPSTAKPWWLSLIRGPVIVAGSTHEGEEELMISAFADLKADFPDLNLVLAPRHPERFPLVEGVLRSRTATFLKRSLFREGEREEEIRGTIILLDTVGELAAVYQIASLAVIGKSFRGYGGQNPLEPAYWGVPVICGPHMENFPVIQDFYRAGGAVQVTEEKLTQTLRELLGCPEKMRGIGEKANAIFRQRAGAVEKAMETIARYMSTR